MFYEVLMEKRAGAMGDRARRLVDAGTQHLVLNPYVTPGVIGGGLAGAAAAGEGERAKGALGGALVGGLAGKGLQSGLARLALKRRANMGDLERAALMAEDNAATTRLLRRLQQSGQADPKDINAMYDRMGALFDGGLLSYNAKAQLAKSTGAGYATGLAAGGLAGYGLRKRREKR
jgi:hypothetical protein